MKPRITSLAIVATALIAVGCSSDADPAAETTATDAPAASVTEVPVSDAPAADGPSIQIEGFAFTALDPVAPGTEITVANLDGALHTLTAEDGSFNTEGLEGGATTTITAPDAPGTYGFVCNIHPSMAGTLTVEA